MSFVTADERLGTTLARKYRLESTLGQGGMGVVFSATHQWTGRQVAVKVLRSEHSVRDRSVARLLREAQAAASLHHPNVVEVLDMGQDDDGTVFLVLELLRGESLRSYLHRFPVLGVEHTLELLVPVMRALAHAHERDVIHRDLKPENIFLCQDSPGFVTPKVLDFGVAKLEHSVDTALTRPGQIVGTPEYMSPEQAVGRDTVGTASDVWSMGVILYEALSGGNPFLAEQPVHVLTRIVTEPFPALDTRCCGPQIAAVVHRALEREVPQRFANMAEFLEQLLAAASGEGVDTPPEPTRARTLRLKYVGRDAAEAERAGETLIEDSETPAEEPSGATVADNPFPPEDASGVTLVDVGTSDSEEDSGATLADEEADHVEVASGITWADEAADPGDPFGATLVDGDLSLRLEPPPGFQEDEPAETAVTEDEDPPATPARERRGRSRPLPRIPFAAVAALVFGLSLATALAWRSSRASTRQPAADFSASRVAKPPPPPAPLAYPRTTPVIPLEKPAMSSVADQGVSSVGDRMSVARPRAVLRTVKHVPKRPASPPKLETEAPLPEEELEFLDMPRLPIPRVQP